MSENYIQFKEITKTFGGVIALKDVSVDIARGECHGLMGENGAGKSTLGKVLAGIHKPDSGEMYLDGKLHSFNSPRDAMDAGVSMVHQELAFCKDLSVSENLSMGHYPRKLKVMVDRAEMDRRALQLLSKIGVTNIDVEKPMTALSTAQEQLVQIAAAVGIGPRIIVFDEPTSSLAEPDAQNLFKLIESLKEAGMTMIYVSHRMPELFRLCDKISVLRDGQYVGTLPRAEATQDAIVKMMIGRSVAEYFPQHVSGKSGDVVLRVTNLSSPGRFRDISFEVHAGEIVGFAGLVGSGRSEVAKAIFGLDSSATGKVEINGKPLALGSTKSVDGCGGWTGSGGSEETGTGSRSAHPSEREPRHSGPVARRDRHAQAQARAGSLHRLLRQAAGEGLLDGGASKFAEWRQPAEGCPGQMARPRR